MARIAIHPGEHLAEALSELEMSAAELVRQLGVPNQPDHRNPEWAACHYRGHGFASRSFFWHECGTLAEPATKSGWPSADRGSLSGPCQL
jgi:hypothetical protein